MSTHKPHWPDVCQHLAKGGVFVGTTVDGDEICDVYLWDGQLGREVCIRYGAEAHEYQSCYGAPEKWSDPQRTVNYHGKPLLASNFNGPAMELVRAFLQREKNLR